MSTSDLQSDRLISRRLGPAWDVFFARFGRLTAVQRAAIPEILLGGDVLVCAATATGKTEAACAPLVGLNLARRAPWTILYVSPTRALVNDLYERLLGPLDSLGLRIIRRTGEHRQVMNEPPHILLTTPESFDSLLCRGKLTEPEGHLLGAVTAVVLDEIHLLHATARGEQVRWLLHRLRRLREEARRKGWVPHAGVQVVGLSATLPDPQAVASAYLSRGKVVIVPGAREIEVVAPPVDSPAVEVAVPAYLAGLTVPEKVLVFCNTRRRVDELTARLRSALRPLGYGTWAHHGSLGRTEREAAELAARNERKVVLVATSTLEIGVDIGDIDLIVLDGPAPDIPALLQRVGRGSRRLGMTRVMTCSNTLLDAVIHSAMIEAARDGWLGPVERGPQLAVARQQVASYIFQSPRRVRQQPAVQAFVQACAPSAVADSLLDHMAEQGELVADGAGLRLGEVWLEQTARGEIHSTIEVGGGAVVEDQVTGRKLASGVILRGAGSLSVGGQLLQVRAWSERKVEVARAVSEGPGAPWSYHGRGAMKGAGQPQAVRRYLGLVTEQWPVIRSDEGCCVFHFGAATCRALLELAAAQSPAAVGVSINDWYLRLPDWTSTPPAWLTRCSAALVESAVARRVGALERLLARPHANRQLPEAMRVAELKGWLRIDEQIALFKRVTWVSDLDPDLTALLELLQQALTTD